MTNGSYSDYHIIGVFDKEDKAERIKEQFEAKIEEYTLNPDIPQKPKGYTVYDIRMRKNGDVSCISGFRYDWTENLGIPEIKIHNDVDVMQIQCFAKNEKHAIKIANEKRAELIANNQWGEE